MTRLFCLTSAPIALILCITLLLGVSSGTSDEPRAKQDGQQHDTAMDTMTHGLFKPDDINWNDGPASLPRGAQYAVLSGNPAKSGPFTMRVKVPADYEIPPHWHPGTENITVISGEFHLGMGETIDRASAEAMPAGSFAFMMPGMRHFAFVEQETVVQLHGIGPWDIRYVDSADDPRISPRD